MENLQKDNMKPFKSNKLYEIPVPHHAKFFEADLMNFSKTLNIGYYMKK